MYTCAYIRCTDPLSFFLTTYFLSSFHHSTCKSLRARHSNVMFNGSNNSTAASNASSATPALPLLATQASHAPFTDEAPGSFASKQDMLTAKSRPQSTAISVTVSKYGGDEASRPIAQSENDEAHASDSDDDSDASDTAGSGRVWKRVTGDAKAKRAGKTFCDVVLDIQNAANATGCTTLSDAMKEIKETTKSARKCDPPEMYQYLDRQRAVLYDLRTQTTAYNCTIWPGTLKDRLTADSESYLEKTASREYKARSRR